MDYRRFMEAECGQSNPFEQLSGHVTHDHAHRQSIGHPSGYNCSQVNQMPPQTFRMDGLMQEMNAIDSQTAAAILPNISCTMNHVPAVTWTDKYNALLTQENLQDTQERLDWNEANANQQRYNSYFNSVTLPSDLQQFTSWQPENECIELDDESDDEIEEDEEEEESEVTESSDDETSTSKLLICWEGCAIVDEFRVSQHELDEPHLFFEFDQAYEYNYRYGNNSNKIRKKYSRISENKLLYDKSNGYNENNPMIDNFTANEESVIASNKANIKFNDISKWLKLCEVLYKNNEYQEALSIANQILKLAPNHLLAHFYKAKIYYIKKCDYQTCQSIFNWLKYHQAYCDIIPPNFKMENKSSTELDKDTLYEIKKMFIKAAQRNPFNPDVSIQDFLGMICDISGEYEQVADCLRVVISNDDPKSRKAIKTKFKICSFLFYANKAEEAIPLLLEIAKTETFRYEAYRKLGFFFMYLKNYKEAAYYLEKGLKEKYNTLSNAKKYPKEYARLSLCLELLYKSNWRGNRVEDFENKFPEFVMTYFQ